MSERFHMIYLKNSIKLNLYLDFSAFTLVA